MEFEDRCHKVQEPKFDCLLFDLDDTLYPLSSGIASHVKKNIGDYMVEKLGIEESKIETLGNLLYKNYGTTMAGLRAIGYSFDYDEYHSFVHGRLPYENIKPDPVLKHILKNLRIRKLVRSPDRMEIKSPHVACYYLTPELLTSCLLPDTRVADIHQRRQGPCRESPQEAGPGGLLRGDHLLRDPEPAVPVGAVRRRGQRLRHRRPLLPVRRRRRAAQDPRALQAQRRRHGGGPQDRQREPSQGDLLRRQRAQHPGREEDRPPHGAGGHAAAGEGRGPRAGEHPQHQGGAAGAVGGGREGGGRAHLLRPRRHRDLGHRVDAAPPSLPTPAHRSASTQNRTSIHRSSLAGQVIFRWEFRIGQANTFQEKKEVFHGSSEMKSECNSNVGTGPRIYICIGQIFACKLLVEAINN